ncbi:MAG: DUF2589 domain-containing protein [Fimbriimonadaceae bacterium]|nr:DUF2589 domain-containing protein [Fimbriimonadaceae bacterium]
MAIDTTPSQVATQSLSAIPFSSLIGGPLDAAIEAQGKSALNTINFIQQVGLQTDANGNKTAVTVSFSYTDGSGNNRVLIVPIITIVPIPYIAVNLITIDFKANINASSSSSQEDTSSQTVGASATVGGSFWGVKFDMSASYSSKKDSKATQDSKYSVEYTMDVHVEAGQTDMPAGLAKVLQILQDGITMQVTPSSGRMNFDQTSYAPSGTAHSFDVTITVIDSNSKVVPGATVTLPTAAGGVAFTAATGAGTTTSAQGSYTFTGTYTAPTATTPASTVPFTVSVQPVTPTGGTAPAPITGTFQVDLPAVP